MKLVGVRTFRKSLTCGSGTNTIDLTVPTGFAYRVKHWGVGLNETKASLLTIVTPTGVQVAEHAMRNISDQNDWAAPTSNGGSIANSAEKLYATQGFILRSTTTTVTAGKTMIVEIIYEIWKCDVLGGPDIA